MDGPLSENVTQQWASALFRDSGALLTDGHFVYSSGRHGSVYVSKEAIFRDPLATSELCRAIADRFIDADIDVVAGPLPGGAFMSQWVAYRMMQEKNAPARKIEAVFTEKDPDGSTMVLKRGYAERMPGKRVLIVDDILTTGGTLAKVIGAVRKASGTIVASAVLYNRGALSQEDIPGSPLLYSLIEDCQESWSPDDCPLCRAGKTVNTDLGHGAAYLRR